MTAGSSRMQPARAVVPAREPRLRADARHNRDRILEAARALLTTRGLDVPMATVARRARVGVATLYRHFPTRDALITTVFTDLLADCVAVVDDALAEPDPWDGFRAVIEKMCVTNALDRGFPAAFLKAFPDATGFERERVRAERGFAVLVQRAKDDGRLRADFARSDLSLILMANSGIAAGTPEAAVAASRRLASLLLHSFRADPADPAGPPTSLPPPPRLDPYHLPWPPAS